MKKTIGGTPNRAFNFKPMAMAIALTLGLGGCSHGIQIAEHADDYNVSVETAENRMFLRNIIRAAKRRPMYFTRITTISSSLRSSATLNPQLRVGADSATENFSNGLSLSTSSSPNVTYQVLQDKNFYNGILNADTQGLLDVFIAQGWPHDILLNVFVENAVVYQEPTAKNPTRTRLCVLRNNPDSFDDISGFSIFVGLAKNNLEAGSKPGKPKTFGPTLSGGTISNAESLKNLKETGFPLVEVAKDTYRLQKNRSSKVYKLRFEVKEQELNKLTTDYVPAPIEEPVRLCPGEALQKVIQPRLEAEAAELESTGRLTQDDDPRVTLSADITLRSAQSMLYYLGQLARVDINPADPYFNNVRDLPVNRAWRMNTGRDIVGDVSVYFDGQLFTIEDSSDDYTDRTMQYLTLVRQVFVLNTAAEETPVAPQPLRLITN